MDIGTLGLLLLTYWQVIAGAVLIVLLTVASSREQYVRAAAYGLSLFVTIATMALGVA